MPKNPAAFAREWEAAWNSHDLSRILAHFSADVIFHSAKANALVGTGVLHGIEPLRAYWAAALATQPDLRFTVLDLYLGHDMLAIRYRNQRDVEAIETLRFGQSGAVVAAAACHILPQP